MTTDRRLAARAVLFAALTHALALAAAVAFGRGEPDRGTMSFDVIDTRAPTLFLAERTAPPTPTPTLDLPVPELPPPVPLLEPAPVPVALAPVPRIPQPPAPAPVAPPAVKSVEHREPQPGPPSAAPPSLPSVPHPAPRTPHPDPTTVVYVLDRSASMGAYGRLDRARAELLTSLRGLPPGSRFQVVAYEKTATALGMESGFVSLQPCSPERLGDAERFLRGLSPVGGNDHARALELALKLSPAVVVLLTDADDLTPADVQRATRANRGRAAVHAVCYGRPRAGASPLDELTKATGGTCRYAE